MKNPRSGRKEMRFSSRKLAEEKYSRSKIIKEY